MTSNKNRSEMLSNGFSAFAIIISIASCFYAKQANKLSEETLVAQNRPVVVAEILPSSSDTNRYFDLVASDTSLFFVVEFKIENIGASQAANLTADALSSMELELTGFDPNNQIVVDGLALSNSASLIYLSLPSTGISLAPGQKFGLTCRRPFRQFPKPNADLALAMFTNNNLKLRFDLMLSYDAPELSGRKFRTRIRREYSPSMEVKVLDNQY